MFAGRARNACLLSVNGDVGEIGTTGAGAYNYNRGSDAAACAIWQGGRREAISNRPKPRCRNAAPSSKT